MYIIVGIRSIFSRCDLGANVYIDGCIYFDGNSFERCRFFGIFWNSGGYLRHVRHAVVSGGFRKRISPRQILGRRYHRTLIDVGIGNTVFYVVLLHFFGRGLFAAALPLQIESSDLQFILPIVALLFRYFIGVYLFQVWFWADVRRT